jgi:hypothetical protein
MSDIVPNWEVIIHKNARTSDRGDAGNVVEAEEDTLTLERGPMAEYVIPKSAVEGFDGSEVSLTISLKELIISTERSKNNRAEGKPRRDNPVAPSLKSSLFSQ